MPLLLATSCLQGRLAGEAVADLLELEPDGVQLCPGNAPDALLDGRLESLRAAGGVVRTHHGYTGRALRQPVWGAAGDLLVGSDSVHPPARSAECFEPWRKRFLAGEFANRTLETMYPGYALGDEAGLDEALEMGQPLAVDVSHLFMQREQGALSDAGLRRVFDYDCITEIHVSHNDGRADRHQPIDAATFGLSWARERACDGTVLILESYFHRLTTSDRRAQLAILRGGVR